MNGIPAERWNAIQQALLLGRDHVPFSVRAKAIDAAEAVVTDWEANHAKWCALVDEVERLRNELLAVQGALDCDSTTQEDTLSEIRSTVGRALSGRKVEP